MSSSRLWFSTQEEIERQEAFEVELEQMETLAWAEYQRKLDAALADFISDRRMTAFQEKHAAADVEYQKQREEWWKSKTKPAPAGGEAR